MALLLTKDLMAVLGAASAATLFWTYFFGVLWGLGGLTFGLTMRYLGISLGHGGGAWLLRCVRDFDSSSVQSVSLLPKSWERHSGLVILLGVGVCLAGIAVSGLAGMTKEREMSEEQKRAVIKEFNFKKGILVATFSGIMSAWFFLTGWQRANRSRRLLWRKGRLRCGRDCRSWWSFCSEAFTTNFIWCIFLNWRNRTGGQYLGSASRGTCLGAYS